MATIDPGNIIRVTARMLLDGVFDIANVYHFEASSASLGTPDDFMTGVAVMIDGFHAVINGEVTTRITYTEVEGINVSKAELLPPKPWPILVAGTQGTDMLPEMNAACVFFRTTRPKTRTAKFLAGYCEVANVGGALLPASITLLNLYGDGVLAGGAADGAVLVYGAFNKLAVRFTPVVSRVTAQRFRTQRRRRIGVGS